MRSGDWSNMDDDSGSHQQKNAGSHMLQPSSYTKETNAPLKQYLWSVLDQILASKPNGAATIPSTRANAM